jgi:hypothetical protein
MNVKSTKLAAAAGTTLLTLAFTAGCLPAAGGSGGGAGGRAPCAPAGSPGAYGTNAHHPERAPLLAERSFAGGVRWAICGASPEFDTGLVTVRSHDGGRTWSSHDTGIDIGFSPHHAGDVVEVELISATEATIHAASPISELDLGYRSTDGGQRWRVESCQVLDNDLTD